MLDCRSVSFFLSFFLSFYLSIYRSIDLSIYLSIYLSTHLFVYLFTPSLQMTVHLSIYLSTYLSTYLPIYLSTYLPIYLSTYLPIYLSTCLAGWLAGCLCLSGYLYKVSKTSKANAVGLRSASFGGLVKPMRVCVQTYNIRIGELSVWLCLRETFETDCSNVTQGQAPLQAILRSRFETANLS